VHILAVIPARAGSKGLPGKNLLPLCGLPLVAHSIELALRCSEIDDVLVSTDSEEIASVARSFGASAPFLRPQELARDETPMWDVVRHALGEVDSDEARYDAVLLLQPTSPARLPEDVHRAVELLNDRPEADGVVAVSEPHDNPVWAAMVERDGYLEPLVPGGARYVRRQDVPRVLNVNGLLYLWRTQHIRAHDRQAVGTSRQLALEVPARRAIDVDTAEDLELAELLIREGLVELPWLDRHGYDQPR
jgi:N-acylneuraminate cytidylyltransferase